MTDIEASLISSARQHAEGCVKIEEDLARYRRVIEDTRPDLIVECGTFSGKSAVWFARVAGCLVATIDTDPHIDPDIRLVLDTLDVVEFVGSSIAPDIVEAVHRLADVAESVLVVLDSDHSAPHVIAEIDAYADMVRPGGYMVVEDTLLRHMPASERKHYQGNPWDAVDWFLATRGDWANDDDLEALYDVTQFPNGWLRRT